MTMRGLRSRLLVLPQGWCGDNRRGRELDSVIDVQLWKIQPQI